MDGRKLTVVPYTREEYDGSQALEWDVYDGPTYLAAFECEADATLFTQADALKRDNARMAEALATIEAMPYPGAPDIEMRRIAREVLASLEVREDG